MHRINFYFSGISIRAALGLVARSIWELFRPFRKSDYRHKHIFEQEAQSAIGIRHAVAVPANRSGLLALLMALGIGKGDEVIVTGYTCSAVPEPILQCGANPVYVDIAPNGFCLNPLALLLSLTPRTRVIILQHTYGFPGPIESVMDIARKHNIFVIEDCALAFGSKKDGRWLGTFFDAAVWSFELSKTLSVGWGGLVGINHDANLANRVQIISEGAGFQGRWLAAARLFQAGLSGMLYHHRTPYLLRHYGVAVLFRFRIFRRSADTPAADLRLPSDQQWEFLLRQLRRIDALLTSSRKAQRAYEAVLSSHNCRSESMILMEGDTYLIRFPMQVNSAQRFVDFFAAKDIEAGRWFSSAVASGRDSPSKYGYTPGSCPVSEQVCLHAVNLPLHCRLTSASITLIAATLDDYLRAFPEEVKFLQRNPSSKPIVTYSP